MFNQGSISDILISVLCCKIVVADANTFDVSR